MNNNRNLYRRSRNDFDEDFEKVRNNNRSSNKAEDDKRKEKLGRILVDTQDFKCAQCGGTVSADRTFSGVNNRNHCPLCLWSRHVDLDKPGDRKAQCKSRMQPLGLTVKHTLKRYGMEKGGELMLVHRCTGCGKHSINRLAADDDPQIVYQLFRHSLGLNEEEVYLLNDEGILLLGSRDLTVVHSQLFGWQSILEGFQPPLAEPANTTVLHPIPIRDESS